MAVLSAGAAPQFSVFTNTTGQAVSDPAAIKAALVRQVVSPVRWEECMRAAAAAGATEFWELGAAIASSRRILAIVVRSYSDVPQQPLATFM